jgi:spermidine synthase
MSYDGVIIDLTDPNLTREKWMPFLEDVIKCVKPMKGGFVMNAGLYLPWNTEKLKEIKSMIIELCIANPEFKYYIYTANIPSFNGEWTFIVVSHRQKFMMEPEFMTTIPKWIRRTIKILDDDLIDGSAITVPNCV